VKEVNQEETGEDRDDEMNPKVDYKVKTWRCVKERTTKVTARTDTETHAACCPMQCIALLDIIIVIIITQPSIPPGLVN